MTIKSIFSKKKNVFHTNSKILNVTNAQLKEFDLHYFLRHDTLGVNNLYLHESGNLHLLSNECRNPEALVIAT